MNVTWRGKTYVGTLLDCTKHDWAPPRFCESPTSDIESKSLKSGRGKRARSSFTDTTGIDTRSVTTSKLRNGKGRRTANSGFVPVSPAKGGVEGGSSATSSSSSGLLINSGNSFGIGSGGGVSLNNTSNNNDSLNVNKRKGRPGDLDLSSGETENSGSKRGRLSKNSESDSNYASQQTYTPCSPVLIECPEPNCSKKYKHINGLKYHQSHAHCGSNFNVVNDVSQESSSNSKDTFATDSKEDGLLSDGDGGDSVVDITDNVTTIVCSKQDGSEGGSTTKLLDSDKHHLKKLNSTDQPDGNSNSCDAFLVLDVCSSGKGEKNESSSCDQKPLSRDESGRPKLGTFGPSSELCHLSDSKDGDERVGSPAYSDISDDTPEQVQSVPQSAAASAPSNELAPSSGNSTTANSSAANTSQTASSQAQQPPPTQPQAPVPPSDHAASEHLNRTSSSSSLQQQQQHQLQSQAPVLPPSSQHHPFGLSPFPPFFGQSPFGLPPPPGLGVEGSQHKLTGSDLNDPNGAAALATNEADLFAYYRYRRAAGLPPGLPPMTPEQQHHMLLQQQQQQLQQQQQQLKSNDQQNSIHQQQFSQHLHPNSGKSGSPTNKEKHHSGGGGEKSKDNNSSNDNYNNNKPPIQELQNLKNRIQNFAFDQGSLYDAQKQQQLHLQQQQQQRSFLEMHHGVSSGEKPPETPTSKSSSSSSKQEKSSSSSKHHHSPHTKNMNKQQQEDRNSKNQQQSSGNDEGVPPTMETTGPPPPTNGYYYNPSYLPPHSFAGMAGNAHHHAHMASSFDSMLRATAMAANHHMALAAAGAGNPYGPPPSHPHHPGFLQSQMARYGSPGMGGPGGNGGPMMEGMPLPGRSSAPSPTTSTPTSAPKTSSSTNSSNNSNANSMHHQGSSHSFGAANQLKASERSSILSPTSNSPGGPNHHNSSNSYHKQSPSKPEHSHSPFSGPGSSGGGHPSGMNMAVSSGHGGLPSTASDPRNSMAGQPPPGMLQHQQQLQQHQQQQQAPRHPFPSAPHVGYSMFDPYSGKCDEQQPPPPSFWSMMNFSRQ